jgi:REP element-mobilizing transposase RayT
MTFKLHHDPTHLYFVTATIVGWKPLFAEPTYAQIVLDSLAWHRRNDRWSIFAFVVMPNHAHWIARPLGERTISSVLQSFGSYTAHAILGQLREDRRMDLLNFFAQREHRDGTKNHQIWLPMQAKNVYSAAFLRQKVTYIHNNPVNKHWRLVDDRANYGYSSACFYDRGEQPVIEVDDLRAWM